MRRFCALLAATMISACATPRVTMSQGLQAGQDGAIPMALPQVYLDITENRTSKDSVVTSDFVVTRTIEDSANYLRFVPQRSWWRETRAAPVYFSDTNVIKTLAVQTLDRRVEFAEAVVSIGASFGVDLTTFDNNSPPPSCGMRLSAAMLQEAMPTTTAAGGPANVTAPAPCSISMRFGALTDDAVAYGAFTQSHATGHGTRMFPYAACRRLDLTVTNLRTAAVEEISVQVPDTRYVRYTRLPHQASLGFTSICSPPDITDSKSPEHSEANVFSRILEAFRD